MTKINSVQKENDIFISLTSNENFAETEVLLKIRESGDTSLSLNDIYEILLSEVERQRVDIYNFEDDSTIAQSISYKSDFSDAFNGMPIIPLGTPLSKESTNYDYDGPIPYTAVDCIVNGARTHVFLSHNGE